MATQIKAYRNTVTEAYAASEKGSGYSLDPWGNDTDRYKGYSEEVTVELADGYEVAESVAPGVRMIYRTGSNANGMDLDVAIIEGVAKVVGEKR